VATRLSEVKAALNGGQLALLGRSSRYASRNSISTAVNSWRKAP
jgi:hypothetical protein